ncbi:MAG: hypothetical protein A3K66_06360 [Euryarchaeota archaeon RBG_16_67_27]|nr:MAG: hypothetical protein A3K66_06360 [Euryarchaeota archaeon RBG_16_67_27]
MADLAVELVDLALNGYPALDLSTVTADEEFVCTPGNRAHDALLSGYRTVFQRMGLTENVDFFINKGIRFADNPSKIVRGSGRPDILLRLVGPQTGEGIGIALEIKSQLTRAGRYADQLLDYERALMRAGYGSYGVRVILY